MKYLILILALLAATFSWSQEIPFEFKGRVENSDISDHEGGVTISVVQNGSTLFSTTSASNGKYGLTGVINYSSPFHVVFSKPGLVGKKVYFDFSKMNEEDIPPGEFRPVESLDMTMFKERENVDFSFLDNEPVAKFDWNTRQMTPRLDVVGAEKMKQKIADLLLDAEKEKAELDANYQAAILAADQAYDAKEYEKALEKYEEALGYKPKEPYPAERIVELDALIQAQKEKELEEKQANEEYDNLISAADNLRDQGNLESAVDKYREASSKKPEEQYPKDQISELTAKIEQLKKEAEAQEAYDAAIKAGETFLKQNSLRAAKDKFTEASELKPSEELPKKRLKEIEDKLNAAKAEEEKRKKYDEALEAADAFFDAEDYQSAKDKYDEALAIESSSSYAKGRKKICEDKLAESAAEQERLAKIEELMSEGQTALDASSYDDAIAKFNEVLTLDTEHAEAKEKLALAEQKKAEAGELAAKQQEFDKLVKQGDDAMAAKGFQDAITNYEKAVALIPSPEVDQKLEDARAKLKAQEEAAQRQEEFNTLIEEGNELLANDQLQDAKAKFTAAAAIDPSSDIPPKKLEEIETKLADQLAEAERQKNYDEAINEANNFYDNGKWSEAKSKYEEALQFTDDKSYAQGRIDDIATKLDAEAKDAERQQKYDEAIQAADGLFDAGKWTEAKSKYEEAIALTDDKAYGEGRIDEINKKLEEESELAERQQKYDEAIQAADGLFDAGKWTEAKTKYEEALGFTDDKSYANGRIEEINGNIAKEQEEAEQAKRIEELLADGKSLYDSGDLEDAKAKYEEVLTLDSQNGEAKDQIAKINNEIAAQKSEEEKEKAFAELKEEGFALADQEKYNEAKLKLQEALTLMADAEVDAKLEEIDGILQAQSDQEQKVNNLLAEGKSLYDAGKYEEAKGKYEEVLTEDAGNSEATSQLTKIAQKLEDQEQAAQREQEIAGLLSEAESLYNSGKLEEAKGKYEEVLQKDPGNSEADNQLNKINQELAALKSEEEKEKAFADLKEEGFNLADQEKYDQAKSKLNEALNLKDDQEIRAKLDEINNALAEQGQAAIDEQYNNLIADAENLESAGNLSGAINKYKEASGVKPGEALPGQKIKELEGKLREANAEAEKEKQYNEHISRGDDLMADEKYLEALREYNDALGVKPTSKEAKDKADEAERLAKESSQSDEEKAVEKNLRIAEEKIEAGDYDRATQILNSTENLKPDEPRIGELRQQIETYKKRDKKYNDLMSEADDLASKSKYKEAKESYESAGRVKPDEQLPKDKAEEMRRLMEEASSLAQKDQLYKDYMDKGATYFNKSEYQMALSSYQDALSVKPGDNAAQNKIDEIQQILDDIANASQKEIDNQNKYDALIKEADQLFHLDESEGYLKAKVKYEEALMVKPGDNYSKLQIDECIRRSREITNKEEDKQYRKLIEVADKYFADEDYDNAKERYQRAISFRASDPYPKEKLAEIEAILNPNVMSSGELEDPGVPFSGSLLDGQALLAQAEAQRQASKGQGVQAAFDESANEMAEIAAQKQQDHYDNSNEIYQTQMKIARNAGESDLGRQETVEVLRASERERMDAENNLTRYEYSENLAGQETLYTINEEVALKYGEDNQVYMDNADMMHSYNAALEKAEKEKTTADHSANVGSDQTLSEYKRTIQGEMIDDFEERALVSREVYDAQKDVSEQNSTMNRADYEANHESKGAIAEIERNIDTKFREDAEMARDNSEDLKAVQKNVAETSESMIGIETDDHYAANKELDGIKEGVTLKTIEDAESVKENNEELKDVKRIIGENERRQAEDEQEHLYKTDAELAQKKAKMSMDVVEMDDSRQETVELLKKGSKEIEEVNHEQFNKQMQKAVANKGVINDQVEQTGEVQELAEEAHARKVEQIKIVDKKARVNTEGIAMSDEAERLNARKSVDGVYSEVQTKAAEEKEEEVKDAQALEQTKRVINTAQSNISESEQGKHYDAADKIHKVDDSPEKKIITPNSLGEDYPEGVTEESFTQNDQNGLMTAIITRRIVVIEGHADVYLRTQSTNAITYSKNGKPTTQHVWNKETQGPHLERHY